MCIYIVPGGVIVIFSPLFKLLNEEKNPKFVGRRMRSVDYLILEYCFNLI